MKFSRPSEGHVSLYDLHQERIHSSRPLPSNCTVTIVGAGEYGTALAHRIARNQFYKSLDASEKSGRNVGIYARTQPQADEINNERTNRRYLPPSAKLHSFLRAYTDVEEALEGRSQILLAVPSDQLHVFLDEKLIPILSKLIQEGRVPSSISISSLIKGIPAVSSINGEFMFATDLIKYQLQNNGIAVGGPDGVQVSCMHGSGYGKQIVQKATYSLSIGTDMSLDGSPEFDSEYRARELRNLMLKDNSMVQVQSGKRRTVEIGAVGKNYVALASNFVKGYLSARNMADDNAFEMAFHHACSEVAFIAEALSIDNPWGLIPQNMDLRLTAYNSRSRNSSAGMLIGQGMGIDEARDEMARKSLIQHKRQLEDGQTLEEFRPTVEGLSVIAQLHNLSLNLGIESSLPFLAAMSQLLEYRGQYSSSDVTRFDDEVFHAATSTWRETLVMKGYGPNPSLVSADQY
jgi:glycerol-3-phosphate dehydrogenase